MNHKIQEIIDRHYTDNPRLRELLLSHSEAVARKALECGYRRLPDDLDFNFIEEAAMLHDIGIICCNAPSIFCHGDLPYICHGVEGRRILEAEGLPRHALVCERHTGAGLTITDIKSQALPLPLRDMIPRSKEERLICYADKFYSKSGDPNREKSLETVISQMSRHGDDTLRRFMSLHEEFG